MNKFKLVMFYIWMLNMVIKDILDQELDKNLLEIIPIQEDKVSYVQKQHQYMDYFINPIWIFHTWEVTSVGYQKKLLNNRLIICLRKLVILLWLLIQLIMELVPIK